MGKHYYGALVYLVAALLGLLDPLLIKELLDKGIPRADTGLIAVIVSGFLVSYAGRAILGGYGETLLWSSSRRAILKIRLTIFKYINDLGTYYHEGESTGSKMQLVADTIDELGRLSVDCVPILLRSCFALITVICALFLINHTLALLACPIIPVFVVCIRHYKVAMLEAAKAVQDRNAETYSFLQEHLAGLSQVQLLNIEAPQTRRITRIWIQLIRAEMNSKLSEVRYAVVSGLFVSVVIAGGLFLGAKWVMQGTLSVGSLIAFYAYLARLFEPMYFLVEIGTRVQRMEACIIRIRSVFYVTPPVPTVPKDRNPLRNEGKGAIECRRLRFAYPGRSNILEDVNLDVCQGESLGITGPSGCGKSTLGKLMVRLYEPTAGCVMVDGQDVTSLSAHEVRERVAYLQQNTILFEGTLIQNLTMGNLQCSPDLVRQAVEVCELSEFTRKLPHGVHSYIGPGGSSVSGGERQRIAIARALLKQPKVLILDETTSGLDADVEASVFRNLRTRFPTMAIIIISHRLHLLTWIDRCLWLSNGRLSPDPLWTAIRGRVGALEAHDQDTAQGSCEYAQTRPA